MLLLENHLSGAHARRDDEYLLHIPDLDQRQELIVCVTPMTFVLN